MIYISSYLTLPTKSTYLIYATVVAVRVLPVRDVPKESGQSSDEDDDSSLLRTDSWRIGQSGWGFIPRIINRAGYHIAMKVSAVLALRALASKIHPPLPLTPRESQQLLSLLTTSFREQLNREHPSSRADDGGETPHNPVPAPQGKSIKLRPSIGASSSARASSYGSTDRHFQSILKNPLFAAVTKDRHESGPRNYPAHHQDRPQYQTDPFDPVAWFEASVASGSATIAKATYAMDTLRKILTSSPETPIKQGMATSLAGSKVLRWLWSSGLQDSLDFPMDGDFIALLTTYLLAEKRHDVILNWFHQLRAQSDRCLLEISAGYPWGPIRLAQRLLLQLVKGELTLGNGMQAAVDHFLRVIDDVYAAGVKEFRSSNAAEEFHLYSSLLGPTGKYLVYMLTLRGGIGQLNPDLLERFTRSMNRWVRDADFYRARMHLQQPVNPSAAEALAYLKQVARKRSQIESAKKRRAIVHLSLGSASLLLQQDLYREATWVMDFLRRGYATELGIVKGCQTDDAAITGFVDRIPSAYDEISNLELLASLDLR